MKQRLFFAIAAAALASFSASVYAQALPAREAHIPGELIIQFNSNVTDEQIAAAFQHGRLKLKEHLQTPTMKGHGKIGLTRVATTMPLEMALAALNDLPGVDFAEVNGIATADFESNDPYYLDGSLWGLYSNDLPAPIGPGITSNPYGSQVEKVWAAGFVGSPNVYVGIIDTGFQPDHPDLAANVWTNPEEIPGDGLDNDANGYVDDIHGWNALANNGSTFVLSDDDSHGTHVAGTIGAVGGDGRGVVGMNWDVTLISGKFLGAGTSGSILDAIKAIDYMVALKTRKGLNIVALNNSWSYGGVSLALQDAFGRAAQAGILTICSASNASSDNDSLPRSPASLDTTASAGFDAVVCVAAIDSAGSKASFSNYGRYSVDLGAPGVGVLSSLPDAEPPNGNPGGYGVGNGTSMSTPHVTGAVALYASVYPGETALQIKTRLLTAGVVNTPSLDGFTLTGGRLDAHALLTGPATTITVPTSPSGLTAIVPKASVRGVVNLTWTDASTNEKGFVIERKASTTTTWQMIASVPPNTKTFSNSGLASRMTYNYRVRAFNVAGSSSYSNTATETTK